MIHPLWSDSHMTIAFDPMQPGSCSVMEFINRHGDFNPVTPVFLSENELKTIQDELLRSKSATIEYSRKLGVLVGKLDEPRRFLAGEEENMEESW